LMIYCRCGWPPGSIQRRWHGRCDAAQEKHSAGGERKKSLRQPAALLWILTIMKRRLSPIRSGNIKIHDLTPTPTAIERLERFERLFANSKTSLRGLSAIAGFVTFLITALLSFFVAILIVFLLGLLNSLSVPLRVPAIVCVGGRRRG